MTDQQILFIARNYTSPYHSLDDLLQEGRILVFTHPELEEEQLIKKIRNKFTSLKRTENRRRNKQVPLSYADNIGKRDDYFTPRNELEELLVHGYTNKEIALRMGVSRSSVDRLLKALRATYTK